MPPEKLAEMRAKLDDMKSKESYKDLIDQWVAGRLTVEKVIETRDYMHPEWYGRLMQLAICSPNCKFLTSEELHEAGYPAYMWSTKSDDENYAPESLNQNRN